MDEVERTHPSFLQRLRDRTDHFGWLEFHQKYGHMLYRYARCLGVAHSDAEDVVQEVEMQFFKALNGFDYDSRKGRFRGYLRAAVLHAVGRRASRDARQPIDIEPGCLDTWAAQEVAPPDEQWEAEWQLHCLRRAVQAVAEEFDPLTLKAFEMHVLAGCTAAEAARALDISKWSVYRAGNRVLARVRERLAELGPEAEP